MVKTRFSVIDDDEETPIYYSPTTVFENAKQPRKSKEIVETSKVAGKSPRNKKSESPQNKKARKPKKPQNKKARKPKK